jgi:hypothetical protein
MNKTAVALALVTALGISGCSSTPKIFSGKDQSTGTVAQPEENQVAIKDTRIATNFKDEGVRIVFGLDGKLDRLEVIGSAPAWKGNVDVLAEADAMDKLVKFVHGRSVSTDRRVTVMAKAIDRAQDNTLNRFRTQGDVQTFEARDLEAAPAASNEENSRDNTSRRVANRLDETVVKTVTTITSQGRLTGVRKISDSVEDDGRLYVAVYQWSGRDQSASEFIRSRMK